MTTSDARFAAIYESFLRRLYGYSIRRTTPDRVDDVVAETFLIAWRRIDDVPSGDEALLWLYGVAYKVLGNQWRGHTRRQKLEDRLSAVGITPVSSVEDYLIAGEESRQALQAVSRLKRTDQEILKLAMWEEMAHQDIALVLGIRPGAVKQRLYEARKNLTREYNRLETDASNPPLLRKEVDSDH